MGPQSAGWSYPSPDQAPNGLAQLLGARNKLCQSLEKTRELGSLVEKAGDRMRDIQDRVAPTQTSLSPLKKQQDVAHGLSTRIDKALEPAKTALKMFDVVHSLRGRLMGEPMEDFDGYLAAIMQLEEALDYLKHNASVAVKWFQEAVKFLEETASTDSYHLRRLKESLTALKAQEAGQLLQETENLMFDDDSLGNLSASSSCMS